MGRARRVEKVYTREDGVRAFQLRFRHFLQGEIAIAEVFGLDSDPWISRYPECLASVERALDRSGHRDCPPDGQDLAPVLRLAPRSPSP